MRHGARYPGAPGRRARASTPSTTACRHMDAEPRGNRPVFLSAIGGTVGAIDPRKGPELFDIARGDRDGGGLRPLRRDAHGVYEKRIIAVNLPDPHRPHALRRATDSLLWQAEIDLEGGDGGPVADLFAGA
jgi:hypothetical protein